MVFLIAEESGRGLVGSPMKDTLKQGIAQMLVVAGLGFAAALGTWWVKGPPSRVFVCDPATLAEGEVCLEQVLAGDPVLWVDARPRAEWERDGVVGSELWNLDPAEDMQAFEAAVAMRLLDAPRVVVYCGDENCGVSRQVADQIRKMGLGAEPLVLKGGWAALRDSGLLKGSSAAP